MINQLQKYFRASSVKMRVPSGGRSRAEALVEIGVIRNFILTKNRISIELNYKTRKNDPKTKYDFLRATNRPST